MQEVKKENEAESSSSSWDSVDEDDLLDQLFFADADAAGSAASASLPPPPQGKFTVMPAHVAASVATAKTVEDFVRAHYESERLHAEQIKAWAIMAPPDKPNLTTVPWQVEMIQHQIPNKSELSKRTETSNATTQKKKPQQQQPQGCGKKGKKKK